MGRVEDWPWRILRFCDEVMDWREIYNAVPGRDPAV